MSTDTVSTDAVSTDAVSTGFADGDCAAQLTSTLDALQGVLDEEAVHLLGDDPSAVERVAERKQALLGEIERRAAGLRGADDASAVDAWLMAAIDDDADRTRIRDRLLACAERNLANGRLLARLRARNEALLATLTGSRHDVAGYASAGTPTRSRDHRSLARA